MGLWWCKEMNHLWIFKLFNWFNSEHPKFLNLANEFGESSAHVSVTETLDAISVTWIHTNGTTHVRHIEFMFEGHCELADHVAGWTTDDGCTEDFGWVFLYQHLDDAFLGVANCSIELAVRFRIKCIRNTLVFQFILVFSNMRDLRIRISSPRQWNLAIFNALEK